MTEQLTHYSEWCSLGNNPVPCDFYTTYTEYKALPVLDML